MKHLIHYILIITIFYSCKKTNHVNTENDLSTMKLIGKVKKMEEKYGDNFSVIYYFNEAGNIDKIDKNHNLTIIEYDSLGNRIEEILYSKINNQKDYVMAKKLYKNNLPLLYECFNSNGKSLSKTEFIYEDDYLIKQISYTENKINYYFEYKNDQNGNQIEIKKFNAENELTLKNTYEFNDKNNKTEFIIYDWKTNAVLEKHKYTYDNNNEIKTVKAYNGNNVPINITEYSYEYKYDSKGNWTYYAKYANGIKQKNNTLNREIEYY